MKQIHLNKKLKQSNEIYGTKNIFRHKKTFFARDLSSAGKYDYYGACGSGGLTVYQKIRILLVLKNVKFLRALAKSYNCSSTKGKLKAQLVDFLENKLHNDQFWVVRYTKFVLNDLNVVCNSNGFLNVSLFFDRNERKLNNVLTESFYCKLRRLYLLETGLDISSVEVRDERGDVYLPPRLALYVARRTENQLLYQTILNLYFFHP